MSDPRIGSELAGYRIEAMIGRGGMGVVYRAEDLRLGRKVALKLLAPELAENEGFRERFESESRLAAAIDHPHIIPLYEAGNAEGLLFLIMRYVDGIDLKALLKREGTLPLDQALAIAGQIGGALDAAHARGLVHRDVKPANVLVTSGSGPDASYHSYLTDFGLTKDTSEQKGRTETGQFFGTIAYVAPEQIDGATQGGAADQYALACVLFECLTGHPPFERATELDIMWAHLSDDPPSVTADRPDLPPALDAVVARALAKVPEERHESCAAMVAAARATAAAATVISSTPASAALTRLSQQPEATSPRPAAAAPADATRLSTAPSGEAAKPRRRALLGAVAAVAALAAGAAGVAAGGSGEVAAPDAANVAATGGISLRFGAEWEAVAAPPAIPGLEFEDRIAIGPKASGGREGLVAGRVPSSGLRLLPAALLGDAGAPAPDAVRLGDAEAFRYKGLQPAGFTGAVTVYLLLTDKGRAAIACYARSPSPRFEARCADLAASLQLTDARALALAPSPEFARGVSDLLAGVVRDRAAGQRRLREAKTSVGQSDAAAALATTYATAARRARGLAAPAATRDVDAAIGGALRDIGRAYSAAATAARARKPERYTAAGRAVRRGDAALRAAVGALAGRGYAVDS